MGPLQALAQGQVEDFRAVAGTLGALALILFGFGLHYLRRGRLYENTPTSRIRSAAQGFIELEGYAMSMPGNPIIAPLTGGRCCWFRCQVEYRDSTRKKHWSVIHRELSGALFHLRDDTGECVVNPDSARVLPSSKQVWYGPLPRPPWGPAMGRGLLRAATAKYRYTEERIDIDAPLYALGLLRTHRGAEAAEDPRAQQRDLLLQWKRSPEMMARFDTNGDGQVDAIEWEAARHLARQQVQAQLMQEMPGADIPVLGPPKDSRPYLLSALPQAQLIARKRRKAWRCLGGAVLTTAALAYLLSLRGLL